MIKIDIRSSSLPNHITTGFVVDRDIVTEDLIEREITDHVVMGIRIK